MSLPLERWARQAVLLDAKGDPTPAPDSRIWDDLDLAKQLQRLEWRGRQRALRDSGDPEANEGTYASLAAYPPGTAQANVPSISGEASLWNSGLWTAMPANGYLAPEAYRLITSWNTVTVASPASLTINPRVGVFAAGASSAAGIALGADAAITLTASVTTLWWVRADLTVRSIGAPGANSTMVGFFHLIAKPATAGGGAVTQNDVFGHTVASFDASVAQGVTLGMANTVTTINYAVQQIHWASWN